MKIKKIVKAIEINAPAAKVWEVLVTDELNREWLGKFSEGTYAITDWKTGSPVKFVDKSGMGMLGFIKENREPNYLEIEYTGFFANGKEDFESEDSQSMAGSTETYALTESNGLTRLDITSDMGEE